MGIATQDDQRLELQDGLNVNGAVFLRSDTQVVGTYDRGLFYRGRTYICCVMQN